ncbi:Lrp/AsnC family transcriptional regulator [Virgibacillus sp. DJP39]|uniref:Lrp/AsnC family transcriptional regulator n=1 Tax=Virgibacillus sp. DJP39 TaxID=3409790 RepID=UPI003BB5B0AC
MSQHENKKEIDELDKDIIKFLSENGRMSFSEIAGHLDVTEKTVRTRYNNMVDANIIKVIGVVNQIELGIRVGSIIQLKVTPQKIDNVIEDLKKVTVIRYISSTSGEYQLLVQVNVRDNDELNQTIKTVQQIPDISSTNLLIQTEVFKNTFDII